MSENIRHIYEGKLQLHKAAHEKAKQLANQLAYARLAAFVAGGILTYFLLSFHFVAGIVGAVVFFGGFLALVKHHAKIEDTAIREGNLMKVNEQELAALEGDSSHFDPGKEYIDPKHDYSYDLSHIGHYYNCYLDLMEHWDTALPGKVHRVQYEDLIDDLETIIRGVLAHLGLDFEENCLRFHENRRAVKTASAEQVRRMARMTFMRDLYTRYSLRYRSWKVCACCP